jgi:hypothetical protein
MFGGVNLGINFIGLIFRLNLLVICFWAVEGIKEDHYSITEPGRHVTACPTLWWWFGGLYNPTKPVVLK